ncbi:hypothetical protein SUGI_0622080 [Cryptomeria japonica]|nr:hypothetical protein SUGI_0622080 [Cryptomeria japonica]
MLHSVGSVVDPQEIPTIPEVSNPLDMVVPPSGAPKLFGTKNLVNDSGPLALVPFSDGLDDELVSLKNELYYGLGEDELDIINPRAISQSTIKHLKT